MLAPRAAYARGEAATSSYILSYVLFLSLLIAAAASVAATGRITAGLLLSLSASWMFVPLLHIVIGAGLVTSSATARVPRACAIAWLLRGHAPWSLWMLCAAVMIGIGGYRFYSVALWLALIPIALTIRIVHAFCLEILQTSRRGAVIRTLGHQAATWLVAAVYLDRAVSLVPRVIQWLS